jgi:tryptophan synthase alpha chain
MNRIDAKFKELKRQNKKAFIAFITAGYPNLRITRELILKFSEIGVDIIELGVPFSDPMADGPLIQESSQVALRQKVNLIDILRLVKKVRLVTQMPICLMTYYNPVFCFGEERFLRSAKASGVDGVIIPDLPPEEAKTLMRLATKFSIDIIFFISPTTLQKRMKFISKVSKGFIYYISLTGVTGPRQELSSDLLRNLKEIKKYTSKPVCVGFGVSNRRQVSLIYRISSGVIVGSAIIKKIKENIRRPDLVLVKRVCNFVRTLKDV